MTLALTPAVTAPAAPQSAERQKLAQAAKQFEAIFVRQMLASARKADFGGDILGGQGMDTFRTMQDERFADIAAETGAFGMARMIEAQLAQQVAPQTSVTSPPPAPPAGGRGAGGPALPGREL